MNYKNDIYRKFEKLSNDYIVLKDRLDLSQGRCHQLDTNLQQLQKSKEKMKAGYEAQLEAKGAIIKALRNELAHAKAIAGHDRTNTGIPTSQTPAGKNKVIPNMRVKSGKKKGGQPGHERHILEGFQDEEITDTVFHEITDEICGSCEGSGFEDTGERIFKDENDIKIVVVKRRHEYIVYRCLTCGALVHMPIERRLNILKNKKKMLAIESKLC